MRRSRIEVNSITINPLFLSTCASSSKYIEVASHVGKAYFCY
jgi:hypothetical protein